MVEKMSFVAESLVLLKEYLHNETFNELLYFSL